MRHTPRYRVRHGTRHVRCSTRAALIAELTCVHTLDGDDAARIAHALDTPGSDAPPSGRAGVKVTRLRR